MKSKIRLALSLLFGFPGLLIGIWYYNSTITPIDRPFFLSNSVETIIAARVDWLCNCAEFIDTTNYKINPVTEASEDDYFFIESARAGQDWKRDHFTRNRYVRLTGRFYIDKGIPLEFDLGHMEDKPNHARVFKFDKIEYLTTDNNDSPDNYDLL